MIAFLGFVATDPSAQGGGFDPLDLHQSLEVLESLLKPLNHRRRVVADHVRQLLKERPPLRIVVRLLLDRANDVSAQNPMPGAKLHDGKPLL